MGTFVIKSGRLIDPYNSVNEVKDIYVVDGRVAGIGEMPESPSPHHWRSEDASGCLVTPGLVDCHVHAYEHATPLGLNIDQRCLARGVTSVVDAGSAGSATFPGLRKFIQERCRTRLYSWLHIAQHGLAAAGCVAPGGGGECDSLNVVNVADCTRCIDANRDMIIGVKVRLAALVTDNGKNEQEVYRRSIAAARQCKVPLMVHHAISSVPHAGENGQLGCPEDLQAGDVYTHCYHGHNSSVLDPNTGRVDAACWEAKRRGVLFDVGHGRGSFAWRVAEQSVREGFFPDMISTDLHTDSQDGPAYDLPCVMARMLHLGMDLEAVIAAVTCRPAQAIDKLNEIGHLGVGMPADVSIFRLEDVQDELEDSEGQVRTMTRAFLPVSVFLGGEKVEVNPTRAWPSQASRDRCAAISEVMPPELGIQARA